MTKRINESYACFSKKIKNDNIVNLEATTNLETIFLNKNKSSWIKLLKLDDNQGLTLDEFEDLWSLRPIEKLKIKIAGKLIDCPRYSKNYLKVYNFSGLAHTADPDLPEKINKLLYDFAHSMNSDLNQSLVNWYEHDGAIGKHGDETRQLIEKSDIFSFSFGPALRTFILEPKFKAINEINQTYHVKLEHNVLVIMGGDCQKTHLHSVPKVYCNGDKKNNRRLNITFRCFK